MFRNDEIKPVNVPRFKTLSLKHVFEHAVKHFRMKHYLPDMQDNAEPQIDREFLFTIVNTIDRAYFPRELKRIDQEKLEAMQKAEHDVIEIRPEMLELLESFGQAAHHGKKAANARSLAQLKTNAKKRSHKEAVGDNEAARALQAQGLPAKRFKRPDQNSRDWFTTTFKLHYISDVV